MRGRDAWIRARDTWEEARTWEGAVKGGSGGGGGIYRAVATRRCGWGHVNQGWGCVGGRGESMDGSRTCGSWTGRASLS